MGNRILDANSEHFSTENENNKNNTKFEVKEIVEYISSSPSEIILNIIKMRSFIQMCTILEKDYPNDGEFGTKIRKCIKTFNQNNNT